MASKSVDEIYNLAVSLTLESKSFDKQMTAINKVISNSEKAFKTAGKGVENYENTFVGLNNKIEKSETQLELYRKKLGLQRDELDKTEETLVKQRKKLEEVAKTVGENSKEYTEWANKVQASENKLRTLSTGILDSEKKIELLSQEIEESKQKFESLGMKIKTTEEVLSEIDRQALLTQTEMDKLGQELEESGNFFQKLGHQLTETATKLETGMAKVAILTKEVHTLSQTLHQNREEQDQLAVQIEQTNAALFEAESQFGENSTEAQQLKQMLLTLKDQYQKLETEIDQNQRALDEYQIELNQTQTEVQELSTELKKIPFNEVSQQLQTSGQKFKSVGQSLTLGVTTPILAAGAAATKAGTDFDTSMSKLQATAGITDKTSESFQKLEQKAKEMGSSTSFSASDAADGLTYLALAGWGVETSIERIEPILRAAEAGNMELATASDLVTDSMSSASVAADDFTKYLDIVAQSQRKSNTSMEQMLEAYIGAGGIFKQLNIPLEESGALLGVLANRGKKGSEAANGLISVFSNLITETGQAGNALAELDISLYDSQGKQRNMIEVLKEMAQKLGVTADGTSKLTEQQQQQYAAMVGGKTQFDTLMAALSGVSGEYDELHEQLVNSNGALEEVATTMKDNLGGEIESMSSALEGSLINAFKAMEPVLSTVVGYVTDAANWFSSLDEEQQKNIVTLGLTAAAVGPLLAGIGQLLIVGGNAVTLFGSLSSGTGGLTSALGVFAGPVGVGLAIGALVALMAYLGDSEQSILWLQEKFGGLGTIIGGVCEFVSGVVQLTLGNILSWIQLGVDVIAAMIDGPGGATIEEAWARIDANNTEGMQKVTLTTTRGMSQMRYATDESLNDMLNVFRVTLSEIPGVVEEEYGFAANKLAGQLQGMDNTQLTILRGMNDTTGYLFRGIRENMTVSEQAAQIKQNLKDMANAGKLDTEAFSQDIQSAMETMSDQLDTKTSEGGQKATTNTETMKEDVVKDTKEMSQDSQTAAKEMATQTIQLTQQMKSEVTKATDSMANQAISDWNRVRNAYSRSISGNVTVTTRNVQQRIVTSPSSRTISPVQSARQLLDVSPYQIQGYNLASQQRQGIKIIRNMAQDQQRTYTTEKNEYHLHFNFENVNSESQKELKKIVEYVNKELQKLQNRNRQAKGKVKYAT